MSDLPTPTHSEYKKIIEKDLDYCNNNLAEWEAKLKEAQINVDRWSKQVESTRTVYARIAHWNKSFINQ